MNFNCKVNVVDEVMGRGKSSAAINYINASDNETKFIVIVPFLSEVTRYIQSCTGKKFKEPTLQTGKGKKIVSLKSLVAKGKNIVSTHALFKKFDREVVDMLRLQNYVLIMDEVADVITPYEISSSDIDTMIEKYVDVDKKLGLLSWKENAYDYGSDQDGFFTEIRNLCDFKSLALYNNKLMWLFPFEVFGAFTEIFILTYMFEAQLQCYYYRYYGVRYSYYGIEGDCLTDYHFIPVTNPTTYKSNYKDLINILEDDKLNKIGDMTNDLCVNWFKRNTNVEGKDNLVMQRLRKNLSNFFKNKACVGGKQSLWTTFIDYAPKIKDKGYTKSFLAVNARAQNCYGDRTAVAYIANRYLPPEFKAFFNKRNIYVDEDAFALSELLQFIWRAAIRNGQPIQLYIPSARMRYLLQDWIEKNSL